MAYLGTTESADGSDTKLREVIIKIKNLSSFSAVYMRDF